MKINRTWKIVIGISTLLFAALPFLFFAFFFTTFLSLGFAGPPQGDEFGPAFFVPFFLIVAMSMCILPLQLGLLIFYPIHLIKNKAGAESWRIATAIGMYFLPYVAMPFYFLVYVWPENPPEWALETGKKK